MSGHDPEQRAIETLQFRGQLAEAAKKPEFLRAELMIINLQHRLLCPYLSQDECFELVYGPNGASVFWGVECSEPIKLSSFVELLAVTGASNEAMYNSLSVALWQAILAAFNAGERTWFVGDTTPLDKAENGWRLASAKGLDKLKVRARDAAEWLLRMPKRRHLVPEWLVTVLRRQPPVYESIAAPIEGAAAGPPTVQKAVIVRQPLIEGTAEPNKGTEKLPPFDRKAAMALLVARKVSGVWRRPPIEDESKAFLKKHFSGVPNDPHRELRREVWRGQIRRGPKRKSIAAD